jgi:flagellar protein FliS
MISQQNQYFETRIQTATPDQLLIMLMDGAIRFCKQGIEALHQKRFADAHNSLIKVQDIIQEFVITIDKKSAVAESLLRLYEYFNFRLIEANTRKDAKPAEEVLTYLLDLKETWMQAAKLAKDSISTVNHG